MSMKKMALLLFATLATSSASAACYPTVGKGSYEKKCKGSDNNCFPLGAGTLLSNEGSDEGYFRGKKCGVTTRRIRKKGEWIARHSPCGLYKKGSVCPKP